MESKEIRRTITLPNYPEPNETMVSIGLKAVGHYDEEYSEQLIKDLYNVATHTLNGYPLDLAFVDIDYDQYEFEDEEDKETVKLYNDNVVDFLKNFNIGMLADVSDDPLKIASLIYAMLEQMNKDNGGGKSSPEGGEGETMLDIFSKEETQELASKLEQTISKRRPASEGVQAHYFNPEEHPFYNILNFDGEMLKVIERQIEVDSFKGLIKAKSRVPKTSAKIKDLSDITKLRRKSDMIRPDFAMKLLNKDLFVKTHVKIDRRPDTLFLMIDDSGSMRNERKVSYLRAILLNRLEKVINQNSELVITWFVESCDLDRAVYIRNKKEALDYVKKVSKGEGIGGFRGCGTNIENSLVGFHESICKGQIGPHSISQVKNPVITIVNDGEDSIKNKDFDTGFVVNSYVLVEDGKTIYNKDLKQLIETNGGEYLQIQYTKQSK